VVSVAGFAAGFSWFEQAKKNSFPTHEGPEEVACFPSKRRVGSERLSARKTELSEAYIRMTIQRKSKTGQKPKTKEFTMVGSCEQRR
jgi:hypothetical protein